MIENAEPRNQAETQRILELLKAETETVRQEHALLNVSSVVSTEPPRLILPQDFSTERRSSGLGTLVNTALFNILHTVVM